METQQYNYIPNRVARPREIGKRNGIVERIFHFSEPLINPKKTEKNKGRIEGITGKQFRREEKRQRAIAKAEA